MCVSRRGGGGGFTHKSLAQKTYFPPSFPFPPPAFFSPFPLAQTVSLAANHQNLHQPRRQTFGWASGTAALQTETSVTSSSIGTRWTLTRPVTLCRSTLSPRSPSTWRDRSVSPLFPLREARGRGSRATAISWPWGESCSHDVDMARIWGYYEQCSQLPTDSVHTPKI